MQARKRGRVWLLPLLLVSAALLVQRTLSEQASPGEALKPIRLTAATLQATLDSLPSDSYLLVELFAPWCPVCQRFRPHYERLAACFNGPPSDPLVRVAQVDCVAQARLCTEFGVRGYPTLRFGHPADFTHGSHGADVDATPREADVLLAWLNNKLGRQWTWEVPAASGGDEAPAAVAVAAYPAPPQVEATPDAEPAAPTPGRMDLNDVELATLLSIEYAVQSSSLQADTRQDFELWLALLSAAHPIASCAAGATALAEALPDVWPAGQDAPPSLSRFRPCGVDRPRPSQWGACRGATPDSRGYSCGLWTLFHALAARVEPRHGGALWITGVRAFVGSFFNCDDCRRHFMERTSGSDVASLAAGRGGTARSAVLWAWRIHNEVNARLAIEDGKAAGNGTGVARGDDAHPKRPWPGPEACPACACASSRGCRNTRPGGPGGQLWDEDAVELFLARFYGTEEQAAAGGEWDPFGLARVAADGEAATARKNGRQASRRRQRHGDAPRSGRILDQHEPDGALSLHAAPGGWSPPMFILMCALAPVALYALYVSATAHLRSGRGRGKGQKSSSNFSGGVMPMLSGRQKTGLGASLAALHGQSLKTV